MQKFCKVCQDAGKSEEIYRSHFIRETKDLNSKVTCPTLLSQECRFCYKNGHTTKYCPTLKEKNRKTCLDVPVRGSKSVEVVKVSKQVNTYACLDSDSEEECLKVSIKTVESFPQLCATIKKTVTVSSNNYVGALSSIPIVKPSLVATNPVSKLAPWVTSTESQAVPAIVPLPPFIRPIPFRRPTKNWADDTDSDEEDDVVHTSPNNLTNVFKPVVSVDDDDW